MDQTNNETALTQREQRIFDFINDTQSGVIASVDPNGNPHATVVYHSINKNGLVVSFLTKTGTKKYDNLIHDNHVVLAVFDPSTQTIAQVIGRAELVKDRDEINEIAADVCLTSLSTSEGGIIPIAKLDAGEYTAFKINPAQIRMARYQRPDFGDYSKLFDSIESFELKPVG